MKSLKISVRIIAEGLTVLGLFVGGTVVQGLEQGATVAGMTSLAIVIYESIRPCIFDKLAKSPLSTCGGHAGHGDGDVEAPHRGLLPLTPLEQQQYYAQQYPISQRRQAVFSKRRTSAWLS